MLPRLLVVLIMGLTGPIAAPNLAGVWTFEWNPDFGGQHGNTHECRIAQNGEDLTIQCDEQAMKGKVHGRTVTFQHTTGVKNEITATCKVTLQADDSVMTGTWHLSAGPTKDGKFQARKH